MKKNTIKAVTLTCLVLAMAVLTWLMFAAVFAQTPSKMFGPWMALMKVVVVILYAWLAWKFLDLVERVLNWPKMIKTEVIPIQRVPLSGERTKWESDPRD